MRELLVTGVEDPDSDASTEDAGVVTVTEVFSSRVVDTGSGFSVGFPPVAVQAERTNVAASTAVARRPRTEWNMGGAVTDISVFLVVGAGAPVGSLMGSVDDLLLESVVKGGDDAGSDARPPAQADLILREGPRCREFLLGGAQLQ